MLQLYELSEQLHFPAPSLALHEPNGLLAYGGDLSVERLRLAYRNGIFPWFGEGEPILWWSPDPRGVLPVEFYSPSKSLRKFIRKTHLRVSVNIAFNDVIEACATVPRGADGVWITKQMQQAYCALHQAGDAHSFEVWDGENLVGGLYGVCIGAVFCGESMFHKSTNASKLAFHYLVDHLTKHGIRFIDTQLQNNHLESLGVIEISRHQFLQKLNELRNNEVSNDTWQTQFLT